jgi:hypothetical protein
VNQTTRLAPHHLEEEETEETEEPEETEGKEENNRINSQPNSLPFNNIHSLTTETSLTVFARDDVGFKMISSIVSIHSVSYCSTEAVAAGVSILQIKAVDAVLGLIDKQQTFTVVAQRQSFQYIL